MEEVKKKTKELLRHLAEKGQLHCFDQWKIRMQGFINAQQEYIEGETKQNDLFFFNKNALCHQSFYLVATPCKLRITDY